MYARTDGGVFDVNVQPCLGASFSHHPLESFVSTAPCNSTLSGEALCSTEFIPRGEEQRAFR